MIRRLYKILRFLSFFSLILTLLLVISLQFSAVQKFLINYFLEDFNNSIQGKLSFTELEGSLFHHFKLKNVKLLQKEQRIISIDKLELQYSPLALLSQKIKINNLNIINPSIVLLQEQDQWNIIAAFQSAGDTTITSSTSAGGQFNWEISIAAFNLDSGRFQIQTDSVLLFEKSMELQDFYLKCSGIYNSHQVKLVMDDFRFRATQPNFKLTSLKTRVSYYHNQIKIDYFQLKTDSSYLETNGFIDLAAPMRFSIQSSFQPLHLVDLQKFLPKLNFYASSRIDFMVQGKMDSLSGALNLAAKDQKIAIKGTWRPDSLNPKFSLHGSFSKLNLADFTGNSNLGSAITGNFSSEGKGIHFPAIVGYASIQIDSTSQINRHRFENSRVLGQLDSEKFKIDGRIGFGNGYLSLKGQTDSLANLPQYHVKLLSHNFPIHQLVDFKDLHHPLNATISINGVGFTPGKINAHFNARIDSNNFSGIPFRFIVLKGHWRKQNIAITQGDIQSPLANFQMEGDIGLDSSIAINYKLMIKDSTPLPETLLPESLKLDGCVQGEVVGKWDSLVFAGQANIPAFSYENYRGKNFRLQFKNHINLTDSDPILMAKSDFDGQIGLVQFDANLQIDSTQFSGSFQNQELISQVNFERYPGQAFLLRTSTQLADTIQVRIDSLQIQYADIRLKNTTPALITYLPEDFVQIENFQLNADSTAISAVGVLPFVGDQHFELSIANFDMNLLTPWIPEYPVTGILDIKTTIDGTFESPLIASYVLLTNASFKAYPLDSLAATFLYGNRQAKFNLKLAVEALKARFTSSGQAEANLAFMTEDSIRLHEINEMKIQCQNWELDFLRIFLPEIEKIAGQLSIDVALNNLLKQPSGTGTIQLKKGQFKIPETGVLFQDIELNGNLEKNRFQLQKIFLKAPEGTLNGEASAEWQGFTVQNFNLNLKMNQFLVMDTNLLRSRIESDLKLWGNPDSQQIAGDLTVLSSRLNLPSVTETSTETPIDINISPDSMVVDSIRLQQEALFPEIPLIKNLRGAVKIKIPRNSWIRNDMLNVEYSGDLTLVKESPDFALFGSADVVRGTVNVYGRQFQIEKGSINFRGEPYPNPALYIMATHKIRQQNTETLLIQVIVGGTAQMPQLTLQSEPYLEQKDIVSYLVFGKPFDFLTSGELKEMNGTYSEKMGAILVGMAARQLSQVIARQLNLDIVEFDLSQESNAAGFKVGKYLNDELFVLYSQDLKSQENQSLMIEYQLNKYLSIRASRTRKGDKEEQGIDIFYKKEW